MYVDIARATSTRAALRGLPASAEISCAASSARRPSAPATRTRISARLCAGSGSAIARSAASIARRVSAAPAFATRADEGAVVGGVAPRPTRRSRPIRRRSAAGARSPSSPWPRIRSLVRSIAGCSRAARSARPRRRRIPLGASVTVAELDADPHPVLAQLRAHEPVSWMPALERLARDAARSRAAGRARPGDVHRRRPAVLDRAGRRPSMLSLDGAEHARHREPFARPFRLDAVRTRFADGRRSESRRLIDAIEAARRGRAAAQPRGAARGRGRWCTRSGSSRPTRRRCSGGTTRSSPR